MNASARLMYVADADPAPRFSELDDVRSARPLARSDGSLIETGALGTVLLVLGGGAAYEVEFGEDLVDLITVNAEDLAPDEVAKA